MNKTIALPLTHPASFMRRLALVLGAVVCFVATTSAQSSGTGTITGRVLSPASGLYLRNAEVRIVGTNLSATTEDGGIYTIFGIPPGEVQISVNYTGYRQETAKISVVAGATVTRDFDLVSSLQAPSSKDGEPIKLSQFVVSTEREGNAKAIQEQRNSMNITNTVASDVFGDVAEGNVGEFVKNLPGVQLDLVEGEIRFVRLRGLSTDYTNVTINGLSLASADGGGGGSVTRAYSFEQVSLSSMEQIEINKTVSADVEANSPAGTINLKPKRAFDRKGRRISWQANFTAFSEEFHLRKTYGPDDKKRYKLLPGFIFDYSNTFFNDRLGIAFNVSESNVYNQINRITLGYNYITPTAADPRPAVLSSFNIAQSPRTNERFATTLTVDFKATPNLAVGLNYIFNHTDLWFMLRSQNYAAFTGTARSTIASAGDPLLGITSATNGTLNSSALGVSKTGQTVTYLPSFDYKSGNLSLGGKLSYTHSRSWYDPATNRDSFFNTGAPSISNVQFTANRSSLTSGDLKVRQIGGLDWADGGNFTNPAVTVNDQRYALIRLYNAALDATLKTNKGVPIVWKSGFLAKVDFRDFKQESSDLYTYNYVGPSSALGAWRNYNSPYPIDGTPAGASSTSISGGRPFLPANLAMAALYREHPEYFSRLRTATNYFNSYVGNRKHYVEQITAGYTMATATVGRAVARAGIRWEETRTDSLETDPRTPKELVAAGYTEVNGQATTVDGMAYQYFSKPKVHRLSNYHNYFPSASVKYRLTQNLDFHLGYSKTIRRPNFPQISGVRVFNDDATPPTITAPNPKLRPEYSDNYSARLAYYFEPVGTLNVTGFQNQIRNQFITNRVSAADFGYAGTEYENYTYVTTTQSPNQVTLRGVEVEYTQSLSFLPAPFKGFGVRANYTRLYAQQGIVQTGVARHAVNGGLTYSNRRFNLGVSANWIDDQPTNNLFTAWNRHRINVDANGGLKFNDRISMFFTVRNVLDEPYIIMQQIAPNPAVATNYWKLGASWTFGIKGTF